MHRQGINALCYYKTTQQKCLFGINMLPLFLNKAQYGTDTEKN